MTENMDKKFLEGIDPESIQDVEWRFEKVIQDEELEKLLREIGEEGFERSQDEKEFEAWRAEVEKRYAEAPAELKEWAIKVVNDKIEELGEFYEELKSLDYREKNSYVMFSVTTIVDHPDFQENEDPKTFLERLRQDAEIFLEEKLLERSLQIRRMLKNAEEGWRSSN